MSTPQAAVAQTTGDRRSANIARHEEANSRRAAEAAGRKADRRFRHELHVESQQRGRAARSLQRDYDRLLAKPDKTEADYDDLKYARDAASNERAFLDYR